jgi:hypothetical protein
MAQFIALITSFLRSDGDEEMRQGAAGFRKMVIAPIDFGARVSP